MWNVDLYAPNYNGYVATITYYPTTGGTFNLGSFLMSPCTVSVDYPYGDFHLFFSAFGSTCIVSTIGVTPTPTETIPATPTMTPTPSVTIGLTPTATPTTTLTSTPTASNTPTPSITPTTTLTATPSSTPPSTTPTSTPTTTLTSTPSNTPTTTLTASPTTTSTPTSTPPSVSPTSTPTGQLFIYGKYINSTQEVGYSINGGSYIGIGDPTSECNFLTTISGLVSGDDIDFVTIGTCSIGGDTSTCPAGTSGCIYSHTFVGTTSIYLTIDASNCC